MSFLVARVLPWILLVAGPVALRPASHGLEDLAAGGFVGALFAAAVAGVAWPREDISR